MKYVLCYVLVDSYCTCINTPLKIYNVFYNSRETSEFFAGESEATVRITPQTKRISIR